MAERAEVLNRLQALRRLLIKEQASTQDELKSELEKLDFEVNQSTISRDLRKLGAIKLVDATGRTVYRLAESVAQSVGAPKPQAFDQLVSSIESNQQMVVVLTQPGSASLVARLIDSARKELGVLGTIAGDDTVFVCPGPNRSIQTVVGKIRRHLLKTS